MKLSRKEYMTLTTTLFVINLVLLFLLKSSYERNAVSGNKKDVYRGDIIVWLSQISGAFL